MVAEIVDIPVVDLLLDTRNARLVDEQPDQPSAMLSLAQQQGKRLLKLAADIVNRRGLDPTALLAVIASGDQQKRYIVLEGNRRVLALKALETPSLVAAAFDAKGQKQLNNLSKRFAQQPIGSINAVLFEEEDDAIEWIALRHTGQNQGAGLVEWGADEKDRWASRHGVRSPARQVLELVERHGQLSDSARASDRKILTNLTRLINAPAVRQLLGIKKAGAQLLSWHPTVEVAKGLSRLVEDLKTGEITVPDIYTAEDRVKYAQSLPASDLPDPASRLAEPKPLDDLISGKPAASRKKSKPTRKGKPKQHERTAVIPQECQLDISLPRINKIYNELLLLSSDQYPNAAAVITRVFVELSVDHYVKSHQLLTEEKLRNTSLAARMKVAAANLKKGGQIDGQLETAIKRAADSRYLLAASAVTFNQYVHNPYTFPKPTELRMGWDELQPFVEQLWA